MGKSTISMAIFYVAFRMFTAGYITEDAFSIEPESQGVHDFSLPTIQVEPPDFALR